ncbi:PREDICTED: flowering time control protein FCA-like isoform X2 [Nelumbo nucifera]|uniref:Flowering time control protein FCA n=1 Tax=Nelumbo nucifera TaxID=4432 RepID=A0A1U8A371_NELNU|nr:PREDICTED: flowering time control protein FCA-like isoform X2 [Nelumbo nucifera]
MDRHRGERSGSNPDSHHNRHSRMFSRSSENPMNHHRNPNYKGGFSGGGRHHHEHRPFNSPPNYTTGGGGFRSMGSGDFGSGHPVPLSGQKRGFPFSGRGGSPDNINRGTFAKLFVGSVPRTATEEDIRPLFEEHGNVIEVALIKDRRTGQQQGCCFIKYATSEEADRAIRALHNQYTLPGGVGPIQVRYADGERERLVEFKLFVGCLNRQATEKEVEEIFSPYGRVEDVYIMRDELKQSRGCGFVRFSHRDMAEAAINALNGIYVMRGCDQPLTVRFADPKRPRSGESRGSPGFGSRSQAPLESRPEPNFGEPMGGHVFPNAWHPMSPQNLGPASHYSPHSFGSNLVSRGGALTMPPVTGGPLGLPTNGSLPGLSVLPSSTSQQISNPSIRLDQSVSQKISPLQKPLQSPQHLPPSLLLHPQQALLSYSQPQTSQTSVQQPGQLQITQSSGPSFSQVLPSQQPFGLSGQLPISQPQVQQSCSISQPQVQQSCSISQPQVQQSCSTVVQQTPQNSQKQAVSIMAGQQQLSAPSIQQPLLQPLQQSSAQFSQMLSQQMQVPQASSQSSRQSFSQLQQHLNLMQPSSQNLTQQQSSQASKQQPQWTGTVPQTASSIPATSQAAVALSTASAASAVHASTQTAGPLTCNWTEHTSPEGFKYYYNSVTSESRWEKPEELTLFEQQQQRKKPLVQQLQAQTQTQSQILSAQQISQIPQAQLQIQLHNQQQLQVQQSSFSSSASTVVSHQSVQELGYAQLPTEAGSVIDPARFQQGVHAVQNWMWKGNSAGT